MVAPRSFADVVSWVVTVAFHPLLLPIYCTLLVLYTPTPYAAMPTLFKAFQLGGVCLFECIVPLAVIGVFIALGEVSGIDMPTRSERFRPLLFSSVTIAFSVYALRQFYPIPIIGMVIGEAAALFIAALCSRFWKISLHAIGAGAFLAYIAVTGTAFGQDFSPFAALAFVAAGVTAWARSYEQAHSPAQLLAGYVTGLAVMGLVMCLVLHQAL